MIASKRALLVYKVKKRLNLSPKSEYIRMNFGSNRKQVRFEVFRVKQSEMNMQVIQTFTTSRQGRNNFEFQFSEENGLLNTNVPCTNNSKQNDSTFSKLRHLIDLSSTGLAVTFMMDQDSEKCTQI